MSHAVACNKGDKNPSGIIEALYDKRAAPTRPDREDESREKLFKFATEDTLETLVRLGIWENLTGKEKDWKMKTRVKLVPRAHLATRYV